MVIHYLFLLLFVVVFFVACVCACVRACVRACVCVCVCVCARARGLPLSNAVVFVSVCERKMGSLGLFAAIEFADKTRV